MNDQKVAQAGVDAVASVTATMDDDAHRDGVARSNKRSIATHILTWHGCRRVEMPFALVSKWSHDELVAAHERLHSEMPR